MRDKVLHNSFFRFLLVGVGNTLLSMAVTFGLYNLAVLWTLTTPFLQPWLAGKLQAVFVERWANNVSLVVCMGLYTVLNYFGQRFFAFSKTKKGPSSKEEE